MCAKVLREARVHQQELVEVDWKQPDWKVTVLRAALWHSHRVLPPLSAEEREQAGELLREKLQWCRVCPWYVSPWAQA